MELKSMSKEGLDAEFSKLQQQITTLQALQTEIATERRRRRFEKQIEERRAELKALEEKANASG